MHSVTPNMWMLTFNYILGYQGFLFRDFLWLFFCFFHPNQPTQYQETHSTLNLRKKGMALLLFISQEECSCLRCAVRFRYFMILLEKMLASIRLLVTGFEYYFVLMIFILLVFLVVLCRWGCCHMILFAIKILYKRK